ncbi:MAG: AI-2E family transporter [Muribaculaceae bacterium]
MVEARRKYDFDRVVRILFAVFCIGAVIYAVNYLSGVLLPFFVACLMAYILHPMVAFVRRVLHLPGNLLPVIVTLLLVCAGIWGVCWLVMPYIYEEVSKMVVMLTEYTTKRLDVQYLPKEVHDLVVKYVDVERLAGLLSREQWLKLIEGVCQRTWSFLGATAGVIASIFSWSVSLLYLVFILIDYEKITKGFHSAVPQRYSTGVFKVLGDVKRSMNLYFRGQGLIALIVGVMFAIGFSIIGLPMAVVLGLFIGLLNLVPYLQLLSIPIAIFLCLVDSVTCGSNFWSMCAWTTVVYCVVQAIQDLVLTPRIMGKYMAINPVIILLSLSIWGSLLGFVGLIIALPLTALLVSYYKQYLLHIESQNVPSEVAEPLTFDGEEHETKQ